MRDEKILLQAQLAGGKKDKALSRIEQRVWLLIASLGAQSSFENKVRKKQNNLENYIQRIR